MSEAKGSPRILVINNMQMGDCVMSTAALRLLRKMCPKAHITFQVPAVSASLMRSPELADEVLEEKTIKMKLPRSLYKYWRALKYRLARYDICFILVASWRDLRRIKWLSNIPVRVRASHDLRGVPWPEAAHATHVIPISSFWDTHMVDYYQDIIQGFFQGPLGERAIFSREMPRIAEPARRAVPPAGPGQKRVAFCFEGAPGNSSIWPEEYFVTLLGLVEAEGWYAYAAVPEGGTGYTEMLVAQGRKVDTFECADIMECCAWLREADLLISIDTAQVHLAAAMGRPVISLGGPTSFRTRPYSPSGVTLADTPGCYSCYLADGCRPNLASGRRKRKPGFIPQCMRAQTPDMVFARAREILSGTGWSLKSIA
jgi:ADP-heptose:LPS heptosyltransferase